jgi:hypothetical protein
LGKLIGMYILLASTWEEYYDVTNPC